MQEAVVPPTFLSPDLLSARPYQRFEWGNSLGSVPSILGTKYPSPLSTVTSRNTLHLWEGSTRMLRASPGAGTQWQHLGGQDRV